MHVVPLQAETAPRAGGRGRAHAAMHACRRAGTRRDDEVTTAPEAADDRDRPAEIVAGFLATAAIFASIVTLIYRPARIGPAAILTALVAAGMAGGRHARLAAFAVGIATVCWIAGMAIAVLTESEIF